MKLLKQAYEKITGQKAPYYYDYSLFTIIKKPIRKWFTNVVAANCPFKTVRIFILRCCGFKIGKCCDICMRCYFDDLCFDLLEIGNKVTISYGVFFACHGRKQSHHKIVIEDGAYLGMRSCVITPKGDVRIGAGAIIGACTLVDRDVPAAVTAVGVPCRIITQSDERS